MQDEAIDSHSHCNTEQPVSSFFQAHPFTDVTENTDKETILDKEGDCSYKIISLNLICEFFPPNYYIVFDAVLVWAGVTYVFLF